MSGTNDDKMVARKLSFQEAWETSTIFFNDEYVETAIDKAIEDICAVAGEVILPNKEDTKIDSVIDILQKSDTSLKILLSDIALSQEKFLRIISLLRKLSIVPGGFEAEWNIDRVKRLFIDDQSFVTTVANLLLDGHKDPRLLEYLPRYYREKLNLREVGVEPPQKRRLRIKDSVIGTYSALKGHRIEELINQEIVKHGATYGKGRSRIIDTDVDMAIPSLEDPFIVIMVTYQETTASGQTNKARDMYNCYEKIRTYNFRNSDKRLFINFVDGGGWLARKNDFKRLVEHCDYFLNLNKLPMLGEIMEKHLPR